mgnify:FL=1
MGQDISFDGQSQVFYTLEIDIKELVEKNSVVSVICRSSFETLF